MIMGGTTSTTTSNQSQQTQLPAWVDAASQANYQQAVDVAGRPLQQYGGQMVADPSSMTTQGYNLIKSNVGSTDPLVNQAAALNTQSGGPLDISKYMNPYTDEVINRTTADANTALTQQMAGNAAAAQKAGAFGGSRFGVQQGVTQAQGVKNIGDISAQLRQAGFDTATQTAVGQQANQRAAATGLLNTAQQKIAGQQGDITNLMSAGQQDQAQQQAIINANIQKFQQAWDYPTQQLNMKLAALGMSPYGQTVTGNKTSETETPIDWATTGLGILKAAPALFAMSDRNTKTDITKLTDDEIPLYSYRYKGDPKSYPKVIGPMAQDIEKKYPSAIKKVGRYKTIDINNLMEVLS
jgi:hypothetical protein